ncbi:MAG: hypothetical protein HQL12_09565 [Candidatus Omnitrophica bacterium]|nr:hypothetical protein [Candidatus Omnitrophota bacterium]
MITQTKITSGDILTLLDDKKRPVSISEIELYLENKRKFTSSIDWLVRKGHAHLVKNGKNKYLCSC